MIAHKTIEKAAYDVMCKAAIDIPEDYLGGIKGLAQREDGTLSSFVLRSMVENYEAATEDRRPMCADTGLPRYYIKVGNDARIAGGFIAVEHALRSATARATHDVPLRPNRVHPLWRTDHNNNVGLNAPEIEWSFEPYSDWVDITTVHKGGLNPERSARTTECSSPAMASTASSGSISTHWSRSASAGLHANLRLWGSGSGDRRTPRWCWANRPLACGPSVTAIPIPESRRWNSNSGTWATISGWGQWGSSARRWLSIATSRWPIPTPEGCP